MSHNAIALWIVLAAPIGSASPARQEPLAAGPARDQRVPMIERVLVRGRVVERDGRPIVGAEVFGAPPCGVPRSEWNLIPFESRRPERRRDFARVSSGGDGSFELVAERGDEIHLAIRSPGWVGLDLLRALPRGASELDVGVLALDAGAVVSGRVEDQAGVPVPGAEILRQGVTEFTKRNRIDWSEVVLARCATDGSFRLDTLAPDPILLEIRAPGFVLQRRELRASEYADREWRVVLERAFPITGRVVGAPAEKELAVTYWVQSQDEHYFVSCATDGSFAIDGLSASLSPIELYVVRRRGPATGIDVDAFAFPDWERISSGVSVSAGMRDVEVRVPAPITYRLRVVDSGTKEPLSGVRIGLLEGLDLERPLPTAVVSEEPGVHSLSMLLPWENQGRALAVSCDGYERVAVGELPYLPGTAQDLGTVTMTKLAPTKVRIVSSVDGSPIDGAAVSALIETNDGGCLNAHIVGTWPARSVLPDGWTGTSRADGTVMAFLSRGKTYWISVRHPDHAALWEQVVANKTPPECLDLHLLRGGTVTVLCLDARTRAPLAREPIQYDHSCLDERHEVRTGEDGRVRIQHLVPCRYRFWSKRNDSRYTVFAEVADGADLEVTLSIGTP